MYIVLYVDIKNRVHDILFSSDLVINKQNNHHKRYAAQHPICGSIHASAKVNVIKQIRTKYIFVHSVFGGLY